jgi:hypothetical protein
MFRVRFWTKSRKKGKRMLTWSVAWMVVSGQLDNGFHLFFAMIFDVAIICGTTAIICDAIKERKGNEQKRAIGKTQGNGCNG